MALPTKASVATLVELSPAVWVVAVVPLGRAEAALRLPAEPVVLAALVGMSALWSAGSWACGRVPVVMSEAETVTFPDRAWPLTVVVFGTGVYPSAGCFAFNCVWIEEV